MNMEALEDPPLLEEGVKDNACDEVILNAKTSEEMEIETCHTSNGIAESDDVVDPKSEQDTEPEVETTVAHNEEELVTKFEEDYVDVNETMETEVPSAETDNLVYRNEVMETEITTEVQEEECLEEENFDGDVVIETEVVEESVFVDGIVDNSGGNITFETEIFIENNAEIEDETVTCDEPDSSNILSELGQNIELSDVLRSSDVSETVENNNCEQEVFNKEELLDILEGNDEEQSRKTISENFHADSKKLEEHLALQQLNRLKGNDSRRKSRSSPKKPEKKQPKKSSSHVPKEAKAKVDDTASTKSSPKGAKGKAEDTASSKISPKESKARVEGTASAKIAIKETKTKTDDATSSKTAPKEAKGKLDDTTTNDPVKEAKGKVEQSSRSSTDTKEKINESVSSNNASAIVKENVDDTANSRNAPKEAKAKGDDKTNSHHVPKVVKAKVDDKPKKDSIVKALVQDWSDDENMEPDESNILIEESETLQESTEEPSKLQESGIEEASIPNECQGNDSTANNADASVSDETTPNNKSSDDTQPQRRLGRVIKKKVIYDPDNPDTFTKTKAHIKKEKDVLPEKEHSVQSTPKKIKADQPQTTKTKSPLSKMQWKKPQPKSSKQSSRRLTEIDRLLMDEGAVNMICQLTPEALKGNKNMKSKAEFIKNIQSNTPDTKEMKFRERKNKLKSESDPKKLGSDKHRLSLSSSVKSPAVSEDFENHSADDSIIYRRHSSSSYSSSCMSPRRLSDVEGAINQVPHRDSQDTPIVGKNRHSEVFMEEKTSTPRRDIMNKSDCLSIKEKLNSKLSQALNKRKLPGFRSEKPSKVKKVIPTEEVTVNTDVTVNFNQNVAEICINKEGSLFSIQIMKVLENIINLVDSNKDITVTLIISECGTICSGLDLKPILADVKHAQEIADHARSLLLTMEKHSKLLMIGVKGKSQGFSLALAGLCDVLLASENASFVLSERKNSVLNPGAGVLTSRALPQNLLKDLIVFGKELSASDALQGGLVSRVIWPERFDEQVRAIARDIATQPFENIILKKQLLGLKKSGSASTFQTCLEKERDLLVSYWTSAEGMQLLRANLDAA